MRARLSPEGEGLQVLVYAPDQNDLFARICGYFDMSQFSILDARVHTTMTGHALDTFQVVVPELAEHYRELVAMVENRLAKVIDSRDPLPPPTKGRLSRRVKSFPITPRVDLRPDEKAMAIGSVDPHTGDRGEEERRDLAAEPHHTEQQRRARQPVDKPARRDACEPCPDERDALAGKEKPIVSVAQGAAEQMKSRECMVAVSHHRTGGRETRRCIQSVMR